MFTQIVQLSDGSTYTHRTTSPHALYRSTKDKMNNVLWQPTNQSLANVEVDEAGKLAAFRGRFGRGFDLDRTGTPGVASAVGTVQKQQQQAVSATADKAKKQKEMKEKQELEEPSPTNFDDVFNVSDLLKGYARKSGIDYSAVKGRQVGTKK